MNNNRQRDNKVNSMRSRVGERLLVAHRGLTLAKRPSESHLIESLRDAIKILARASAHIDHTNTK